MKELGPTYDFYVLWNHDICTSDAEIIKVRCTSPPASYDAYLQCPLQCVLTTKFNTWVKGTRPPRIATSAVSRRILNLFQASVSTRSCILFWDPESSIQMVSGSSLTRILRQMSDRIVGELWKSVNNSKQPRTHSNP